MGMKQGRDLRGDIWWVATAELVPEQVCMNARDVLFDKQGAIDFAAAILEEAGETKLAEMVRGAK